MRATGFAAFLAVSAVAHAGLWQGLGHDPAGGGAGAGGAAAATLAAAPAGQIGRAHV